MFLSAISVLVVATAVMGGPRPQDLQDLQEPLQTPDGNSSLVPVHEITENTTVQNILDEESDMIEGSEDQEDLTTEESEEQKDHTTVESRPIGASRNRIVGGGEVDTPKGYEAFLEVYQYFHKPNKPSTSKIRHRCGGTVVHRRYIITAAHCLYFTEPDKSKISAELHSKAGFKVVVGDLDACDSINKLGQERWVTQVHEHPDYKSYDLNQKHDIAILEVADFDVITPAYLPLPSRTAVDFTGKTLTESGWGGTSAYQFVAGQDPPSQPRQCKLKATTTKVLGTFDIKCMRYGPFQYDLSWLCTYAEDTASCQGDSGGPLVLRDPSTGFPDRDVLVGVVSAGFGCADNRYGSKETSILPYLPWITGIVPLWYMGTEESPGSPIYPNNIDKTYRIETILGMAITVTFEDFDIEDNPTGTTCDRDYVMAKDLDGTVLLPKSCGASLANPVFTSRTNKVEIIFHSNDNVRRKGFKLSWKAVDITSLVSKNYPKNYPVFYDSIDIIETPRDGERIKIFFTDFDLEWEKECKWDYLQIVDSDNTVLLDRSCGFCDQIRCDSKTVISKTNRVTVTFHSDNIISNKGFKLNWVSVCNAVPDSVQRWSSWTGWSTCINCGAKKEGHLVRTRQCESKLGSASWSWKVPSCSCPTASETERKACDKSGCP